MAKGARAPEYLSDSSKRLWRVVLADYQLEDHHLATLRLALEALDRAEQARKFLNENGLTYDDRFAAPRARPEVAIERDSRIAYVRCMRELGLDVEQPDEHRPPALRGQRG